jgi:hypothetical protein
MKFHLEPLDIDTVKRLPYFLIAQEMRGVLQKGQSM